MFLQRHFWAINLGLITLFVWASVNLFLTFATAKLDQRPLPRLSTSTALPQELEKKPRDFLAMLTSHNIFDAFGEGHEKRPEVPAYVPPPPPPLSSQLRLRGTVAGGPDFGLAIVDDSGERRQQVIKIGGFIKNAKLVSVTRNAAVFDLSGRQETLTLLEKDVSGPLPGGPSGPGMPGRATPMAPGQFRPAPGRSSPPTSYTPASAQPYQPTAPGAGGGDVFRPLSMNRYAVDRQRINQLGSDGTGLGQYGKLAVGEGGLTLSDVPPGSLAEKAGLRAGDVIKRINGKPVSNLGQAKQAYDEARRGSSAQVVVGRGGRDVTVNYELR